MSENLKFSMIEDHIGELILSQPKRRNALNAAMWAGLPEILQTAKNAKGIKSLIVRGDGDHFASGADISEFATLYATEASARKISDDIAAGFKALAEFPHPVIAMVRGACVGGGCGLALCCDLRFADSSSKFAITPAKLGLVYPYSDVQRLIETVGVPNAKDILFSARILQPGEAPAHGFDQSIARSRGPGKRGLKLCAQHQRALEAISYHNQKNVRRSFYRATN